MHLCFQDPKLQYVRENTRVDIMFICKLKKKIEDYYNEISFFKIEYTYSEKNFMARW